MEQLLKQIHAQAKTGQFRPCEDLHYMCKEAMKTDISLGVKYLKLLSEDLERIVPSLSDAKESFMVAERCSYRFQFRHCRRQRYCGLLLRFWLWWRSPGFLYILNLRPLVGRMNGGLLNVSIKIKTKSVTV